MSEFIDKLGHPAKVEKKSKILPWLKEAGQIILIGAATVGIAAYILFLVNFLDQ